MWKLLKSLIVPASVRQEEEEVKDTPVEIALPRPKPSVRGDVVESLVGKFSHLYTQIQATDPQWSPPSRRDRRHDVQMIIPGRPSVIAGICDEQGIYWKDTTYRSEDRPNPQSPVLVKRIRKISPIPELAPRSANRSQDTDVPDRRQE